MVGAAMVIASAFLLIGPVLVVLAPILVAPVSNAFVVIRADTRGAQVMIASAMLGAAGLVGGIWLARSGRK